MIEYTESTPMASIRTSSIWPFLVGTKVWWSSSSDPYKMANVAEHKATSASFMLLNVDFIEYAYKAVKIAYSAI